MDGIDYQNSFQVFTDRETKEAWLDVRSSNPWRLYVGDSVTTIDEQHPLLMGKGSSLQEIDIDTQFRSYYKIVTRQLSYVFSDRILPMEGARNLRDLGGIKLSKNTSVKWGLLFRSDELTHLTDSDLLYLSKIGVASIIDFRAQNEIKRAPDKTPLTAKFSYPITISPGAVRTDKVEEDSDCSTFTLQMENMYRAFVSDTLCIRAFRIMFLVLQNYLSAPLIFHCSAGKDRTGIAAALILFSLGASEEVVYDDYLMSRFLLADKYRMLIDKYPRTEPIFSVKRSYLKAAIDQIKLNYGSVDDFLVKALNVNITKMRQLYVQKH